MHLALIDVLGVAAVIQVHVGPIAASRVAAQPARHTIRLVIVPDHAPLWEMRAKPVPAL